MKVEKKPDTISVLVVDDEKAVRDGFERILNRSGLRVLKAPDGVNALEILEKDHEVLDEVLLEFADAAIRTLDLIRENDQVSHDETGRVHERAEAIEKLLARHLVDEEDLAVPIIIHHKLRG